MLDLVDLLYTKFLPHQVLQNSTLEIVEGINSIFFQNDASENTLTGTTSITVNCCLTCGKIYLQ